METILLSITWLGKHVKQTESPWWARSVSPRQTECPQRCGHYLPFIGGALCLSYRQDRSKILTEAHLGFGGRTFLTGVLLCLTCQAAWKSSFEWGPDRRLCHRPRLMCRLPFHLGHMSHRCSGVWSISGRQGCAGIGGSPEPVKSWVNVCCWHGR